jgi:signal transduction histidine kinase
MADWRWIALIGLAGGLLAAAAGWRRALLARDRALGRFARLESVLDEAPLGLLRRSTDGWAANRVAREMLSAPKASAFDPETLVGHFSADARPRLAEALDGLSTGGRRFEITAETVAEKRILHLIGGPNDGGPVIWIRDDTASAWLAEQYTEKDGEASRFRAYLDALPIPVWWRNKADAPIDDGNAAFQSRFDGHASRAGDDIGQADRSRALARLAGRTAMPQTESRHMVVDGARRALDVTETPIDGPDGPVVGSALDVTALEDLQASLADHVAAQDQVLERLFSAIAIYGPDRRLKFFNDPFTRMFRLDPRVLDDQPSMGTLLEVLREGRQVPETSDFPAYKRDREALFTSLIEPLEELLHLPDGRTIRGIVAPHPLGGLVFQYEDVTDRLALESSYNTMMAVQRSTLNALFEGVAVFGRDGRLKLFNDVFANMFDYDMELLAREPHIMELVETARGLLVTGGDWMKEARILANKVSEPRSEAGRMTLGDGRVLDYVYVPLPDGQCLVLYFDVTDTTQVEAALRERNRALENADLLKSRFLSSVSYEFRTPLNAIAGFAELLRLEAFGPLSARQREYVDGILGAAGTLSDLVTNVLDLAAAQAGFLDLDLETVDLGACVAAAIEEDGADLEIKDASAPVLVRADRDRLTQAFRTLLADGSRFSESSARPSVAIRVAEDGGARVEIAVPAPSFQEDDAWPRRVIGDGDHPNGDAAPTEHDIELSLSRSLLRAQGFRMILGPNGDTLCCDATPDRIVGA